MIFQDSVTFIGSDSSQMADSLQDTMKELVSHGDTIKVKDLDRSIITAASGATNTVKYRESFIIAGHFEQIGLQQLFDQVPSFFDTNLTLLTATYNTIPLHSRPLAQNYISNTLLRHLEKDSGVSEGFSSIQVSTHPLPTPRTQSFQYTAAGGGGSLLTYGYGIPIPLGLAILISSFLIFPLNERATNAKQVQLMTGLQPGNISTVETYPDLN